jgi:hypothetical protein
MACNDKLPAFDANGARADRTMMRNANIFLFEEWYNSSNVNDTLSREGSFHNGFLCSDKQQPFWMSLCIDIYMQAAQHIKQKKDVWICSGTNKLRNAFFTNKDNNNNMLFFPYYVVCPFICKPIDGNERSNVVLCRNDDTKPLPLHESSWSFIPLRYVQENEHVFTNSIAVCVHISAGSFWNN